MSNIEFTVLGRVAAGGNGGVKRSDVAKTALESNALANLTRKGYVEFKAGRFVNVVRFV